MKEALSYVGHVREHFFAPPGFVPSRLVLRLRTGSFLVALWCVGAPYHRVLLVSANRFTFSTLGLLTPRNPDHHIPPCLTCARCFSPAIRIVLFHAVGRPALLRPIPFVLTPCTFAGLY